MLKRLFSMVVGFGAMIFAPMAFAQLSDLEAQNVDGLLGVATDGSESGIHELALVVPIGLGVCIVIALSFAGYHLVRRLFMRAQSA